MKIILNTLEQSHFVFKMYFALILRKIGYGSKLSVKCQAEETARLWTDKYCHYLGIFIIMGMVQMSGRRAPSTQKRSFSSIRKRNKTKKENKKKEKKKALVKTKEDAKDLSMLTKIAYCEGVGDKTDAFIGSSYSISGPIYKAVASVLCGIVLQSFKNDILPWLLNKMKTNQLTVTAEQVAKHMEMKCRKQLENPMNTLYWSFFASEQETIECDAYEMTKLKLQQTVYTYLRRCVNYILINVFGLEIGGLFVDKIVTAIKVVNLSLLNLNTWICKLAGLIELATLKILSSSSCLFKGKQKQDLIKSMGPELRLFDNGIKF